MATISIQRTIAVGDLTRAVAALRAHFGMAAGATNAQVQAEWEKAVFAQLQGLVKQHEQAVATKAAADGVADIALT